MLSPAMPVPPEGLLAPLHPGGGPGGAVVFSGVSLVYPSTGRMALRNVCFTMEAGERLGVCGRTGGCRLVVSLTCMRLVMCRFEALTGVVICAMCNVMCAVQCVMLAAYAHVYSRAVPSLLNGTMMYSLSPFHLFTPSPGSGKSSLVAALTRLTDICAGTITINGVSIAAVRLCELRRAVAVVGQEPFLFEGSVRHNLDPEGAFSNGALWAAHHGKKDVWLQWKKGCVAAVEKKDVWLQ